MDGVFSIGSYILVCLDTLLYHDTGIRCNTNIHSPSLTAAICLFHDISLRCCVESVGIAFCGLLMPGAK